MCLLLHYAIMKIYDSRFDQQLASGEVFGPDQPIALKLLGSERSFGALEGTNTSIYF